MDTRDYAAVPRGDEEDLPVEERIEALRANMLKAAEDLDFERAAAMRDAMKKLEGKDLAPRPKKRQRPRR